MYLTLHTCCMYPLSGKNSESGYVETGLRYFFLCPVSCLTTVRGHGENYHCALQTLGFFIGMKYQGPFLVSLEFDASSKMMLTYSAPSNRSVSAQACLVHTVQKVKLFLAVCLPLTPSPLMHAHFHCYSVLFFLIIV